MREDGPRSPSRRGFVAGGEQNGKPYRLAPNSGPVRVFVLAFFIVLVAGCTNAPGSPPKLTASVENVGAKQLSGTLEVIDEGNTVAVHESFILKVEESYSKETFLEKAKEYRLVLRMGGGEVPYESGDLTAEIDPASCPQEITVKFTVQGNAQAMFPKGPVTNCG